MARGELYRAVLSGEASGPALQLARFILFFLSLPYLVAVRCRNILYDRGLLKVRKPPVPAISVGNLTVGGTGKTPLVSYLAREAMKRSLRPAVLARGYKGAMVDGEWINDEGILLRESIPGLAVVQDPDRLAAAQRAVSLHGADLLILDDGFQHRRIGRGVDVVALDARRPFGNGRLLPAGLLREPMSSIRRADALVLTRCECVDEESLKKTEELVKWISRGVPLFRAVHEAAGVRTVSGEVLELSDLDGKRLYLFAGIADPGHFERTAASTGCRAVKIRSFPDHHRYRWEDVFRIVREGQDAGAEGFLTTAKDAVKLKAFSEAQDILVLDIAVRFLDGEEAFRNLVFGRKA